MLVTWLVLCYLPHIGCAGVLAPHHNLECQLLHWVLLRMFPGVGKPSPTWVDSPTLASPIDLMQADRGGGAARL